MPTNTKPPNQNSKTSKNWPRGVFCAFVGIALPLCLFLLLLVNGCGQFLFPELYEHEKEMLQTARKNVAEHSSDEMKECISRGVIVIGMSKDEVLMSWGSPGLYGDINKSVNSWEVHEQWVYRSFPGDPAYAYLYFENGILISWQD